jgi:hypothetical protein
MNPVATTWATSSTESLLERTENSMLVVLLRDVFAQSSFTGPVRAELFVAQPVIDSRTGKPPLRLPGGVAPIDPISGLAIIDPVNGGPGDPIELVPTGIRAARTLSGAVIFPALDRWMSRPAPAGSPLSYRFRVAVDVPGLIAKSFKGEPSFPSRFNMSVTLVRGPNQQGDLVQQTFTAQLLPAPDYRFPPSVHVLNGHIVGYTGDRELVVRARYDPPPTVDTDPKIRCQAMTTRAYPVSKTRESPVPDLAFALGLPERTKPIEIEVYEADGGPVRGRAVPPGEVSEALPITLLP